MVPLVLPVVATAARKPQLNNSAGEAEWLRRASSGLLGLQYLLEKRVFACGSYGARSEG